jgi:hypothetical protein
MKLSWKTYYAKRAVTLAAVLLILLGAATGCSSSSTSKNTASAASQTATSSQSASPSAASCASAGTRKIPKTRLLADLGLTYGAFHRYLYQPYKAGAFGKGASGRTKAIIKAGLAVAAIIKLLDNASKNAGADPTLCKYVPNIDNIKASLTALVGKIKGGTATAGEVDSTGNLFEQLKNQTGFTPPANAKIPGLS